MGFLTNPTIRWLWWHQGLTDTVLPWSSRYCEWGRWDLKWAHWELTTHIRLQSFSLWHDVSISHPSRPTTWPFIHYVTTKNVLFSATLAQCWCCAHEACYTPSGFEKITTLNSCGHFNDKISPHCCSKMQLYYNFKTSGRGLPGKQFVHKPCVYLPTGFCTCYFLGKHQQ